MKSILVTGGGGSAGHNVCWSLRVSKDGRSLVLTGGDVDRSGIELNMCLDYSSHLPGANDRVYIAGLNKVIENEKVELVMPQPDPEVERVSNDRSRIRARIFLPDSETVSTCLDKFAALSRWHESGLRQKPIPISHDDSSNMRKLRLLDYPCWIRAREGAGGLMSCKATSPIIAEYWVKFHWDQGIKANFVAEEYLPGRDFCFMSLWNKGGLVTSMIRERLSWVGHRIVGSGGTSKLNRVVHLDTVNKKAVEAISAVSKKPHGIFCVDLKEDAKAVPCPTEVNCRFTTNVHYLSLASIKLGHPERQAAVQKVQRNNEFGKNTNPNEHQTPLRYEDDQFVANRASIHTKPL